MTESILFSRFIFLFILKERVCEWWEEWRERERSGLPVECGADIQGSRVTVGNHKLTFSGCSNWILQLLFLMNV